MTVGERIKNLRIKRGLSQIELADMIKIAKQNLYKYENNIITNIPSDKIEAIAKALDVQPCTLMGWDETCFHKEDLSDREYNHLTIYRSLSDLGKDRVDTFTDKEKSLESEESDQRIIETFQKRFVARNGNKNLSPDEMKQIMEILDSSKK